MEEPIVPVRTYVIVFVSLLILAALTTYIASFDLGIMNTAVAMAIATAKMALVGLFFMHLWYKPGLTRIIVICGFFWLSLLVGFTLIDLFTRNWVQRGASWGLGN
jgi:cytochrome c oxidase subunit 4